MGLRSTRGWTRRSAGVRCGCVAGLSQTGDTRACRLRTLEGRPLSRPKNNGTTPAAAGGEVGRAEARPSALISGPIVDHAGVPWLMRRGEEREDILEGDFVGIHIVAERCPVVDQEQESIDGVVAKASPVRESRVRVIPTAGPGIRCIETQTQEIAVGYRDPGQNIDGGTVGPELL